MQKTCNRCGTEKPLGEFQSNSAAPDGLYSLCKSCKAVRAKEYRARPEVAEREAARQREQYARTKDARYERRKARIAADPLTFAARAREYEARRPPGWRREWSVAYYAANKQRYRVAVARRRAIKLAAAGSYSVEDMGAMFVAQRGLCACCECALTSFEVDHVIPLSRGG